MSESAPTEQSRFVLQTVGFDGKPSFHPSDIPSVDISDFQLVFLTPTRQEIATRTTLITSSASLLKERISPHANNFKEHIIRFVRISKFDEQRENGTFPASLEP
ncbi:hypothetical protein C0989_009285 [Termitomyces sp. Mn162]|nr:hypothetical protein C0989_009285 [Termitomyces sp. Mn162]